MHKDETTTAVHANRSLFDQEFWGISRHELIAGAAERMLPQASLDKANEILLPIGANSLSGTAGWADRIKSGTFIPDEETQDFINDARNSNNREWHFVDLPLDATAYDNVKYREFTSAHDVVQILTETIKVLQGRSERFSKVNALRLMIHLVGDVHQPVHVACGFIDESTNLPTIEKDPVKIVEKNLKSDRGGNLLKLPLAGKVSLHSYWDSTLAGENPVDQFLDRPILAKTDLIDKLVTASVSNGPRNTELFAADDVANWPVRWATDSIIAAKAAYSDLTITKKIGQNFEVSWVSQSDYDRKCRPILINQMRAAAQNLAKLLTEVLA